LDNYSYHETGSKFIEKGGPVDYGLYWHGDESVNRSSYDKKNIVIGKNVAPYISGLIDRQYKAILLMDASGDLENGNKKVFKAKHREEPLLEVMYDMARVISIRNSLLEKEMARNTGSLKK
jgi:hypothetical protein